MADAVPSVQEARARAWRYWESDGINALITGVAVMLGGMGSLWSHRHYGLGDLLGLLAWLFLAEEAIVGKLTAYIKARITYPRTGYIAKPQVPPSSSDASLLPAEGQAKARRVKSLDRWIWGPLVLFFFAGFVLDDPGLLTKIFFSAAGVWMGLLLWRKRKVGEVGWPQLLILPATFVVIGFLPARHAERREVALIALGAANALWGVLTLCLYLRDHPARPG